MHKKLKIYFWEQIIFVLINSLDDKINNNEIRKNQISYYNSFLIIEIFYVINKIRLTNLFKKTYV